MNLNNAVYPVNNQDRKVGVDLNEDITPDQAREMAARLVRLADEAERGNPDVQELAEVFERVPESDFTMEDLALAAWRAGWRKMR